MALQCDPYGNLLPLHYVVEHQQQDKSTHQQCFEGTLFERVSKLDPDAASTRNVNGQLSLVAALKSDFVWDNGIKALFAAYPEANCNFDEVTKLFPFCLAVVSSGDLTTSFALLRKNPEHVRFEL